MDWKFRIALLIAHETGQRIGAVRQLRWSGIDMERGTIRGRGEHQKTGYEHQTPVTAEVLAGLPPKRGRGWHSLRRKFASDLMDLPLKVVCALGGWKTAETVLQCYQRADEDRLRQAFEERRRAISR